MTLSHTARLASALVIVAFINASYSGEAPPADPLRDEIKQLAALRVGDHAATILETDRKSVV